MSRRTSWLSRLGRAGRGGRLSGAGRPKNGNGGVEHPGENPGGNPEERPQACGTDAPQEFGGNLGCDLNGKETANEKKSAGRKKTACGSSAGNEAQPRPKETSPCLNETAACATKKSITFSGPQSDPLELAAGSLRNPTKYRDNKKDDPEISLRANKTEPGHGETAPRSGSHPGETAPQEFGGNLGCPVGDRPNRPNRPNSANNAGGTDDADSAPHHEKTSSRPGKTAPHPERYIAWKLFWSFLKIGAFTFGGGYAMVPLIQREVTDKRGWVGRERFLELLTLAQSAPGPISLNTAVFVGYNLAGYRGAAAAIFGAVLPSFVVIVLIAMYFTDIKDNHTVEAVFKGMRPAVVALIVAPLFGFTKGMGAYRIGIAVLVAAAIWRLGVSPMWFIFIGAAAGIIWAYLKKRKEAGR